MDVPDAGAGKLARMAERKNRDRPVDTNCGIGRFALSLLVRIFSGMIMMYDGLKGPGRDRISFNLLLV